MPSLKNDLTEAEKDFFNEKFEGRYSLGEQVGLSGARTSTYLLLDLDGNKYALKKSKDAGDKNWIDGQIKAEEKRKSYTEGYEGDVAIGHVLEFGESWLVERYMGETFSSDLYNSLTGEQQKKCAKDLAGFINYAHQKSFSGKNDKASLTHMDEPSFEDIMEYLSPVLSTEEKECLQSKIDKYESMDNNDIALLIHADIRGDNVLYDKDTEQIAVIDFELVKKGSVYGDFVPSATASFNMPYEMLSDMVDYYNSAEKEHSIYLSQKKVKLMHELGCLHEYGRCAMFSKRADDDLEFSKNMIFKKFDQIEVAFEPNENRMKPKPKTPKLGGM